MSEEQLNGQPELPPDTVCTECGTSQQREGTTLVCELGHRRGDGISAGEWDEKLDAANARAKVRKPAVPVVIDAVATESFELLPEQNVEPGLVAMCRWIAPRPLRLVDVQHPEGLDVLEVIVNGKRSFSGNQWKGLVFATGDALIAVMVNRLQVSASTKVALICEHTTEAPTVTQDAAPLIQAPVPPPHPAPAYMETPLPVMPSAPMSFPTISGAEAANYVRNQQGALQQQSGRRAVFPMSHEVAVCLTHAEANAAIQALKNNPRLDENLGSCIIRKLDNAIIVAMCGT